MKFAIKSKLVQDSMWFSLSVKGAKFSWNIELLLITDCKFLSLADFEYSKWPLVSQKKYFYGSKCLFIVFTVIIYAYNLLFWPLSHVQFSGCRHIYIVVQPSPQSIHLQNTFVSPKWDSHPLNNNLPFPPPSLWHSPFYFPSQKKY